MWTLSLRSLPFPLLVLVLVLLGGNRHARRGQSRLLVCQTEEDVGVTAGMHHLRSLHRRRSVSTSILVLIPFPFPFLLLVVILILVLLNQRPLSDHDQAIRHGTRTPRTCRGLQRTSEHLMERCLRMGFFIVLKFAYALALPLLLFEPRVVAEVLEAYR